MIRSLKQLHPISMLIDYTMFFTGYETCYLPF